MRRALRWTGIAVADLLGLAVLGYIAVYALSERVLRPTYPSRYLHDLPAATH
jgi:hypothetical protein